MKRSYVAALILMLTCCSFIPQPKDRKSPAPGTEDTEARNKAFVVLHAKCNFCHTTQNPSKVFTPENMNEQAGNIYRQVFVWRRMPKNKAVTLSAEEEQALKSWLRNHTTIKE